MGYYEDLIKTKQNAKEEKDNTLKEYLTVPFYTYNGRKINRSKDLIDFIYETERLIKESQKRTDLKPQAIKDVVKKMEKNLQEARKHIKEYGEEYYLGVKTNSDEEKGYYAKLAEEKAAKKNAEEKRTFKVMGEEFDISTIGGVKKAADAIERHFKRKRDELGLPSAEEWKAKIGHELLLASRQR